MAGILAGKTGLGRYYAAAAGHDTVVGLELDGGAFALLDGCFGFGQTIGKQAVEDGIARARSHGVSVVALRQAGTWDISVGPAYVEHLAMGFDDVGELWTAGRWWLDMPGLVRWTTGGDAGQEWFLYGDFLDSQGSMWPVHDAEVDLDRVTYLGSTEQPNGNEEIYVCRMNLGG